MEIRPDIIHGGKVCAGKATVYALKSPVMAGKASETGGGEARDLELAPTKGEKSWGSSGFGRRIPAFAIYITSETVFPNEITAMRDSLFNRKERTRVLCGALKGLSLGEITRIWEFTIEGPAETMRRERKSKADRAEMRDYDFYFTREGIGMPTAPAFNRYVQQGLGLEDAYYLANRAEIESKKTAAAKQAAINQTRSKGHLDSGAGGAANAVVVPPEEVELYRAMMPGATDEEIRKDWEKYQKALR